MKQQARYFQYTTRKLVLFLGIFALWNIWVSLQKSSWPELLVAQLILPKEHNNNDQPSLSNLPSVVATNSPSEESLPRSNNNDNKETSHFPAEYDTKESPSSSVSDGGSVGTITEKYKSNNNTNDNNTNNKEKKNHGHNNIIRTSTTLRNFPFGYTDNVIRIRAKYNYSLADLSTNATLFDLFFNNSLAPATSTIAWPNLTTVGFYDTFFYSGYRNEMMAFTILVLDALHKGHNQILLESLNLKDLYATDKWVPFEELFDVEYWNSFYPQLPRLVSFDRILHDQFRVNLKSWWQNRNNQLYMNEDRSLITKEPIHPYASMKQYNLFLRFVHGYSQKYKGTPTHKLGLYNPPGGGLHSADILMRQGALRPNRNLRNVIQKHLSSLLKEEKQNSTTTGTASPTTNNNKLEYITLHPRVEPDMQVHTGCREKKVIRLTQIIQFVEQQWKGPPAPLVFVPINRQILEEEVKESKFFAANKTNVIAMENLKELNRIHKEGLWNGRAKVFELGSNVLHGNQKFEKLLSIGGAIINYEVAIQAKILIGTQVSSYSHDLLATRFFRGKMRQEENYYFTPQGLFPWITSDMKDPPAFLC